MSLKNLRNKKGWSQEKLAEITGLSLRTIQRIEKQNHASISSLSKIAQAFEMDIEELKKHLNYKPLINFDKKIVIYLTVITMLIFINLTTNTKHLWFIYPMIGWGVPLFFNKYRSRYLSMSA